MPKFKPVIRKMEVREDGTVRVKIRVTHADKTRYITTDYYVPQECFDMKAGKIIPSKKSSKSEIRISEDDADKWNDKITIQKSVMIRKCDEQKNIRFMDMASLMEILRDKRTHTDLISMIDDRIAQLNKVGNQNYRESYETTKTILTEFSGTYIPFESIDTDYLKKLEMYMRTVPLKGQKKEKKKKKGEKQEEKKPEIKIGMSVNSIGVHMRNIRTIYNMAIDSGTVELSRYPFRKYKIKRAPAQHRILPGEKIAELYRMIIEDPLTAWARDMCMLSFFLIGINMKDLFYLDKIEDGRVRYIRSKGKKPYNIKVPPEAVEIINRYPGKKYLLSTLENYSYYRTATKRINAKLKTLAGDIGITKPLSTYYMRHSWATIAFKQGIAMDLISYCLGHQMPSLEMTVIYVDQDQEKADDANRKVIDHILSLQPCEHTP